MNGRRRAKHRFRRLSDDEDYYDYPSRLLIEPSNLITYSEDDLVETGILAPDGSMIVRPNRDPIGFLWDQFDEHE